MITAFPLDRLPVLLVCTLATMVIGMLWFSPALFAKRWMALTGVKPKKKESMVLPITVSLVTGFFIATGLELLFRWAGVGDIVDGLAVALVAWMCFVALPALNHRMYDKRPMELFTLYAAYDLAMFVASALILVLWR